MECECTQWACADIGLIINGNGHHPHCTKYEPPPADPRYSVFGKLMWEMIQKIGGEDFCGSEWSEDVLPLAERAGLCVRVPYDSKKHGDIDAEKGDVIWWWGDSHNAALSEDSEKRIVDKNSEGKS